MFCTRCGQDLEVPADGGAAVCTRCGAEVRVPAGAKPKAVASIGIGSEVGGCRIEAEVGRGGMGVVYRATQMSLGRTVAVKVLAPHLTASRELQARFDREAIALARLRHPSIVAVYERGSVGDQRYLVMEHVDGTSLRTRLAAGRMPSAEAVPILRGVLDALEHAHGNGVVHRDLKPDNVMIDHAGAVRVVDFGIAQLAGQGVGALTTSGGVGTLAYMSPEQQEAPGTVDHRTDVYAAGVLLYEMLSGKRPAGSFPRLTSFLPGIDPRFDDLVVTAMHPDREQRYPTAAAMRAALEKPIVAGRAVRLPVEETPVGSLRARWGRWPLAVAAASGMVLLAIAATSIAHRGASDVAAAGRDRAPSSVGEPPEPSATPVAMAAVPAPSTPPAASVEKPEDRAARLVADARRLAAAGDLSAARDLVAQAMKELPSYAPALEERASIESRLHEEQVRRDALAQEERNKAEAKKLEEDKRRKAEAERKEQERLQELARMEEEAKLRQEEEKRKGEQDRAHAEAQAAEAKLEAYADWIAKARSTAAVAISIGAADLLAKAYAHLSEEKYQQVVNAPDVGLLVFAKNKYPSGWSVFKLIGEGSQPAPAGIVKERDKGWRQYVILWIDPRQPSELRPCIYYKAENTGESKVDKDDVPDLLRDLGLLPKAR